MKKTLTFIMLCASLGCFAQKINLVLNLKQDSTYYLKTDANLTIVETINGSQQVISTLISGVVSHKITAIKDTVYEMEVRYRSLGLSMEIGGKSIKLSSDDTTSTNLASKVIGSMLNKPFTMLISNRGKVLGIKNIDNIYSGLPQALSQATGAQKAQFKAQLQQSFGEKSIRANFQDAFAMFPVAKVGINDKWQTTTVTETGMAARITTNYTLKGITDDVITIHGDAIVQSDGNTALRQYNGIPMRFTNVNGNATADITLQKSTGWISEARINKIIKGTVEVPDGPKTPGGMTFPMSITADMMVSNDK